MAVPATHYQPSPRPFPETLPPIEYGATDLVRKEAQVVSGTDLSAEQSVSRLPGRAPPDVPRWTLAVINMWPISIYSTPSNKAQCVNHVPEHPLTMSPVYTEGEGWGEGYTKHPALTHKKIVLLYHDKINREGTS